MKKGIFTSAIMLCMALSFSVFAQNNKGEVLVSIGGESITKEEFLSSYQKNNQLSKATPEELREYLDLYINFKLKVKEGKALKLDTAAAFSRELNAYREQSAQQYLVDKDVREQLVNEAIERANYHIRASHILFKCNFNANAKDSTAAYNRAIEVRNKILGGMAFADAAMIYSDDISARDTVNPQNSQRVYGNKGELGYFTVFNLIYSFETGAYNTPVGTVSMPVKTPFGYHLIYVHDKVPAITGIHASQIFLDDSLAAVGKMSENVRNKIEEIKKAFAENTSFEDIVKKYSDDRASKELGGKLEPFSPEKRIGSYVTSILSIKPKEISEPILSTIGWHIIKLDTIRYLKITDDFRYAIKGKVAGDERSHISKNSFVDKLKKEYNYDESGKAKSIQFFVKNLPENYFQSTATDIETLDGLGNLKPVFTFADQQITAKEFAQYIARFQGANLDGSIEQFLLDIYPSFVDNKVMAYENSILEKKYPEYQNLINEYHEGMLLYEINSQQVWGKAIQDSVGLEKFYEKIKTKYPVEGSKPVTYKPLSEIRALVITEYQESLDKEWIKMLKAKFPVVINEERFQTIFNK